MDSYYIGNETEVEYMNVRSIESKVEKKTIIETNPSISSGNIHVRKSEH